MCVPVLAEVSESLRARSADPFPLGWILQRRDNGGQFVCLDGDDVRLPPLLYRQEEPDRQRYAEGVKG